MKFETINKEGIDALMDLFYAKIRNEKGELGKIFNDKIGTSDEEWTAHKKKISNFWQGMLLGEGDYNGQPLKAHLELPPFDNALFDTWLSLFESSLNELFVPQMAEVILQRAQMIANNFKRAIAMHRGA
ncbi:hypothetical protein DMB92_00365 [Campylobacter sp. MIT 99-7217]|uniref:group III truncated hemoglobin n=1 Tax=Campylobacter sp. MIT 99-7217 TaxID=535091 RepID=UPI001157E1FF|nr:group III truncated hemoglobin [Campylobacter sp. MIT 99-7217]TQR34454.1 hypothetical protein DMB92_00365 [Campylobacter sp. MIT 99-7217]